MAALLEDRRIREQEEAAHRANYALQLEQMSDKLRRNEETLRTTTRDYILGARRTAIHDSMRSACDPRPSHLSMVCVDDTMSTPDPMHHGPWPGARLAMQLPLCRH